MTNAGHAVLYFIAAVTSGIASCQSYRPTRDTYEASAGGVTKEAPAPPDNRSETKPALPSPTTAPSGVLGADALADRTDGTAEDNPSANPAIWGDAAQKASGKTFAPIYFDFDSAALQFSSRRTLEEHAEWLKAHPDVWVTLEGHCDSQGSSEYNYNLGMSRAMGVKIHLVGMGIEANRLFTISYGEERPAVREPRRNEVDDHEDEDDGEEEVDKEEAKEREHEEEDEDGDEEDNNLARAAALNRRVEFLAYRAPVGQTAPPSVMTSPAQAPDTKSPPTSPPAKVIP